MDIKTSTKIQYALTSPNGKVVIDFGNSEDLMWQYVDSQAAKYGVPSVAQPTKITITTTLETLERSNDHISSGDTWAR